MTFNPNSPDVLGMQWGPTAQNSLGLNTIAPTFAYQIDAQLTELITGFDTTVNPQSSLRNTNVTTAEIYPAALFPTGPLAVAISRPIGTSLANANNTGLAWTGAVFEPVFLATYVNNASQSPVSLNTYITGAFGTADDAFLAPGPGTPTQFASVAFNYADISASLAGLHIYSVRMVNMVQPINVLGGAPGSIAVQPYAYDTAQPGVAIAPGGVTTVAGPVPGGTRVEYELTYNPWFNRPWIPADLALLTGTKGFGWAQYATGSAQRVNASLQQWIEVTTLGPETRSWVSATTHVPNDLVLSTTGGTQPNNSSARWAKNAGTSYRVELRTHTTPMAPLAIREFTGPNVSTSNVTNNWRRLNMSYAAGIPVATQFAQPEIAQAPAMRLRLPPVGPSDPVESADSQGYTYRFEPAFGSSDALSSGYWQQNFFTPVLSGPTPYSHLRFWVRKESLAAMAATSTLTVAVYNTVGTKLSSDFVLTPAQFDALNDGNTALRTSYLQIDADFTVPAVLASATEYRIRFTSGAASAGLGWIPMAMVDGDSLAFTEGAGTFNGTTSFLTTRSGALAWPTADISVNVASLATLLPPPGFEVQVDALTDCIEILRLNWDSPGGSGTGFELQRSDVSATGPWDTIATFASLNARVFIDSEIKVNRPSYYRVRTTRSFDGQVSAWSSIISETASMNCCGYLFSTNSNPELLVWADDVGDTDRKFDYPQEVTLQRFYNRDYQASFMESEFRGARFKRTLLIAADQASDGTLPTPTPGQQTFFNELFEIARPQPIPEPIPGDPSVPTDRSTYPYICVVDQNDRWYATVLTPSVTVSELPGWYRAEIEVIEVTNTPYVVASDGCTQGRLGDDVYLQETGCSILLENNDYILVDV